MDRKLRFMSFLEDFLLKLQISRNHQCFSKPKNSFFIQTKAFVFSSFMLALSLAISLSSHSAFLIFSIRLEEITKVASDPCSTIERLSFRKIFTKCVDSRMSLQAMALSLPTQGINNHIGLAKVIMHFQLTVFD